MSPTEQAAMDRARTRLKALYARHPYAITGPDRTDAVAAEGICDDLLVALPQGGNGELRRKLLDARADKWEKLPSTQFLLYNLDRYFDDVAAIVKVPPFDAPSRKPSATLQQAAPELPSLPEAGSYVGLLIVGVIVAGLAWRSR